MILHRYFQMFTAFGFSFLIECFGNESECFDVDGERSCYFIPLISETMDWESAWKLCRDNKATLPVILTENGQRALDEYLKIHSKVSSEIWTAGRYANSSKWSWVNGQPLGSQKQPVCDGCSSDHDNNIVLNWRFHYIRSYSNYEYNYICQLPGGDVGCQSPDAISIDDGCIVFHDTKPLHYNGARSECIRSGGDLVSFSDEKYLNYLEMNKDRMKTNLAYWIGLRRSWWIWNGTDTARDIKHWNLQNFTYDANRKCLYLIASNSTWNQAECWIEKSVVCQREVDKVPTIATSSTGTAFELSLVGIIIGICVVAVVSIAVLVSVLLKKRKRKIEEKPKAIDDEIYQGLRTSKMQMESENIEQYTELQLCSQYEEVAVPR